jgi:hypothetical protein
MMWGMADDLRNTEERPMTDDLKFHPLADKFDLIEGLEFDELVADIKANGLRERIVLFQGMILDGRNRYRACLAAGVTREFYNGDNVIKDEAAARAFVISANVRRRHLSAEQKLKALVDLVASAPEKSDRQLAKEASTSHTTIAKARKEAEATGKALPVDTRVGMDGKARKPRTPKAPKPITVAPEEVPSLAPEQQVEAATEPKAEPREQKDDAEVPAQLGKDIKGITLNYCQRVREHKERVSAASLEQMDALEDTVRKAAKRLVKLAGEIHAWAGPQRNAAWKKRDAEIDAEEAARAATPVETATAAEDGNGGDPGDTAEARKAFYAAEEAGGAGPEA